MNVIQKLCKDYIGATISNLFLGASTRTRLISALVRQIIWIRVQNRTRSQVTWLHVLSSNHLGRVCVEPIDECLTKQVRVGSLFNLLDYLE